jgi:hypothetical protein
MKRNQNDRWITVIGLSILLLEQFVTESGIKIPETSAEISFTIHGILSISIIWMAVFGIVKLVRAKYPSIRQSQKRVLITGISCLFITYILNMVAYATNNWEISSFNLDLPFSTFLIYFTGVSLMVWIICGMYEAGYYQFLLRKSQKERNELMQMQLHSQYNELKNRVNPNFLFSSLNTLSNLVHEDYTKAEKFVDELSAVYRYLLRNNDEQLTSLAKEFRFIESYTMLLKSRFNNNLQLFFSVGKEYMSYLLPPLTLQVLVENAVTHNEISSNYPLYVYIKTSAGTLEVKNNLQRKQQVIPSERSGLNYIISRYANAGEYVVDIIETESEFIVRIPLVTPLQEIKSGQQNGMAKV